LQRFARILYLVSSGGSLKIRQRAAGWTALAWNLRHWQPRVSGSASESLGSI